ncbi:hypothetical protein [Streptomyces noursei]
MLRPLTLTLDDHPLTIPPITAITAYDIAAKGAWINLFPRTLPTPEQNWINNRLTNPHDPLTLRTLWRITHAITPTLFGVEWWTACTLAATWTENEVFFESWAVRQGSDLTAPDVAPIRMTGALLGWLADGCKESLTWEKMWHDLTIPPAYTTHLDTEQQPTDPHIPLAETFTANAPTWAHTTPTDTPTDEPATTDFTAGAATWLQQLRTTPPSQTPPVPFENDASRN